VEFGDVVFVSATPSLSVVSIEKIEAIAYLEAKIPSSHL